jgi:hypothetical protein
VVGGWARVFRKDWNHPAYCSVAVSEAANKKSDGNYNQMWHTKTATMIEKVAKVRALREAFVESVGGMYEQEETGVTLPQDNVIDMPLAPEQEPEQQASEPGGLDEV